MEIKKQIENEKAFFDGLQSMFNIDLIDYMVHLVETRQNDYKQNAIDDILDLFPNASAEMKKALELIFYKLETNEIETMLNAFHAELIETEKGFKIGNN